MKYLTEAIVRLVPKARFIIIDEDINKVTMYKGVLPSTNLILSEIISIEKEYLIKDITNKANSIVVKKYSEIKQRKIFSQVLKVNQKQIVGDTLTPEDEAVLTEAIAVDNWITNIRDIENSAILNSTALVDVVWGV